MEECMRDSMRKLAIWYTRTFKPIITHDELEPIMATMGFIGLPPTTVSPNAAVAWKEYVYSAAAATVAHDDTTASPPQPPPRLRLPYPRIDGLHIYTYRAFLDAVNFYLEMCDISDLFHIRGMPLHRMNDRSRKWRRMEEEESIFVYRDGTLEQATYNTYHFINNNNKHSISNSNGNTNNNNNTHDSIRDRGNNTPVSCLVPIKDIIVT